MRLYNINPLSMKEYYPWAKKHKTLPWNRFLYNLDFLKQEKNRIEKTSKWYFNFLRKPVD